MIKDFIYKILSFLHIKKDNNINENTDIPSSENEGIKKVEEVKCEAELNLNKSIANDSNASSIKDTLIQEYKDKYDVLKQTCEKLEDENEDLRHELEIRERKLKQIKEEIRQKNSDQDTSLTQDMDTQETSSNKNELVEQTCDKLEEENDDLRRELKNRERKLSRLKEEIEEYENNINNLNDDLQKVQSELECKENDHQRLQVNFNQLQGEFSLRNEAIEVVNQILSTNEEDEDILLNIKNNALSFFEDWYQLYSHDVIEKQNKNLDESIKKFSYKSDITALFSSSRENGQSNYISQKGSDEVMNQYLYENLKPKFHRACQLLGKNWLKNKVKIAFVGEFSAGKTSIVNTLLNSETNKLPVSVKATTAIPTYIVCNGENNCYFVNNYDERHTQRREILNKLSKNVFDKIPGLASQLKYFVVEDNIPALGEKITILDTPGFSSNDKEDAKKTINVINETDALFWVVDICQGTLNKSSLEIIKENLRKPLYIILNKIDLKSPKEREEVVSLIKKTLKKEGLNYEDILLYSNRDKQYRDNLIKVITHDIRNNIVEEKDLMSIIDNLKNFLSKQLSDEKDLCRKAKNIIDYINRKNEDNSRSYNSNADGIRETLAAVVNCAEFSEPIFWGQNCYKISEDNYAIIEKNIETIISEQGLLYENVMIVRDIMYNIGAYQKVWYMIKRYEENIIIIERNINELEPLWRSLNDKRYII